MYHKDWCIQIEQKKRKTTPKYLPDEKNMMYQIGKRKCLQSTPEWKKW
jgi:hypothetical protein